uniref:Uncharacterized protein n=1 Tax=Ackermannviridae sp. TaxID=2831612 RepID=A0A8S5VXG0_9CAUD|nr:MAG TPA: hypothetical protein [Ackermannviridae sp.]
MQVSNKLFELFSRQLSHEFFNFFSRFVHDYLASLYNG